MKKIKFILFTITLVIILCFMFITPVQDAQTGNATTIVMNYVFKEPTIEQIKISDDFYDRIKIPDLSNCGNTGEPCLPIKPVNILLPQNKTKINCINIVGKNKTFLGKGYSIEPGVEAVPILKNISPSPPDPNQEIYNSSQPYPKELYSIAIINFFRGYAIQTINLYPIEYIPKSGEIYYYKEIELEIETVESPINKMFRGLPEDKTKIQKMVDNPGMANNYSLKNAC